MQAENLPKDGEQGTHRIWVGPLALVHAASVIRYYEQEWRISCQFACFRYCLGSTTDEVLTSEREER